MNEAVIETFTDVRFIQGLTPMTQDNWQKYFGSAIRNGVYSGLAPYTMAVSPTSVRITDGVVFANGIQAEISTDAGYTDIGNMYNTGLQDRLICVRVRFDTETAQLIQKTNISTAAGSTYYATTLSKLIADESYLCTRNSTYWDIPIFYQSEPDTSVMCGRDLRRKVELTPSRDANPQPDTTDTVNSMRRLISGQNRYTAGQTVGNNMIFFPDPVNVADGAIITVTATGGDYDLVLCNAPFTGAWYYNSASSIGAKTVTSSENYKTLYSFSNTVWEQFILANQGTVNAITAYKRTIASGTTKSFRITFAGITYRNNNNYINPTFTVEEMENNARTSWGLISGSLSTQNDLKTALNAKADAADLDLKANSADVYTKTETDTALDAKANAADVNDALALKANSANVYTKTESDTLLNGKSNTNHTHALTSASITGILPLSKGGTGVTDLQSLINLVTIPVNTEWYVDATRGSDSNDGLTTETAFQTLQHAVDKCPFAVPSTIYLENDRYDERVIISGKNIMIRTLRTDGYVTLTQHESSVRPTLHIEEGSFVCLRGNFTVSGIGSAIDVYRNSALVYDHFTSGTLTLSVPRGGIATSYGSRFCTMLPIVYQKTEDTPTGVVAPFPIYADYASQVYIRTLTIPANSYTVKTALRNYGSIIMYRTITGYTVSVAQNYDGGQTFGGD